MAVQQVGEGRPVVVVGAGAAGVQTVVALREKGYEGPLLLLGDERHRPYDRPPLSKSVLLGGSADDVRFDVDFDALGVEVRLGCGARGLRPDARELDTEQGPVGYGTLVLATGAEPVRLPGAAGVPSVHELRTLDDARRLGPVLAERRDVVVVGAGWIGAEFATAAAAAGCRVTVVEAADRPLAGALPAEVTGPMRAWYREAGVELRTGAGVRRIEDGVVELADGDRLTAGAVLVGVGARPATGWLANSGVATGARGDVLADEGLRTSVPGVYAVGDCASFPSARFGTRLLVHHWDNALQGPRTVAASVTGDAGAVYDPVPYFWSEQFGRFVQYAGHHADADALVRRGDPEGDAWSVCWLRDGRLVAVLSVGRARDLAQGRRLIASGVPLVRDLVADAEVPLRSAVADSAPVPVS
ncbi:NAD(P)/FAD-dependent oxidoreductase [Streptomyces sp. t39]|uniref:NAD(P)/FAD-dependent oxidoreductase n=1 Tax=Streptomyces sp. t39 TaxID=1828156 RepID=UPI0011CE1E81|nr:FAD-dependent oxidoreductase [Streptomyces sp. t39]TXS57349.1 NAD(P)/FAD-dependent oxidoreductase [Streptomyces sp. t39]